MRQLFLFYRDDTLESICEDSVAASNEEAYLRNRGIEVNLASIIAPTIDSCWDQLSEFDDLGLHAINGRWEVV